MPPDELLVFNNKSDRDKWVNFQDEFSLDMGTTFANAPFKRIKVLATTAEYYINKYDLVEVIPNITTDYDIKTNYNILIKKSIFEKGNYIMSNIVEMNTAKKITPANKVKLTPSLTANERKFAAKTTVQNGMRIGTKLLANVPVELMNIPRYQRDRERHLYYLAEHWDDNKCGVLIVSYDEKNHQFNMIDGQHRATAAKMRGVESLPCEIHIGMTESEEVRLFVDANEISKKLSPFASYRANLIITDEEQENEMSRLDKRIAAVCGAYGVPVEKSQKGGVIKSVPHCRKIMKKEGEEFFKWVFEIMQGAHWDKFKTCYCYIHMEALRKIYNLCEPDNLEDAKSKLIGFFISTNPDEVKALANAKYPSLKRPSRWEAVLMEVINL